MLFSCEGTALNRAAFSLIANIAMLQVSIYFSSFVFRKKNGKLLDTN